MKMMNSDKPNSLEKNTLDKNLIYIMGLTRRSGTHFLIDLINHHPECAKSVIPEDYLLVPAHSLNRYVSVLSSKWESQTNVSDLKPFDLLHENLGNALISFLEEFRRRIFQREAAKLKSEKILSPPSRRLITKSPTVRGIKYFFQLFPNVPLLILVRDGRSTVESLVKSFGNDYESAIYEWVDSVREFLEFDKDSAGKGYNYLVIKYEDLHVNTESEMRKILEFLKLDANVYNFQTALNLPVTGSSTFGRGTGNIHWSPVRKTGDFDPLARAQHWKMQQHKRFNWLAGRENQALGYELKEFGNWKIFWKGWNKFQDLKWKLRRKLSPKSNDRSEKYNQTKSQFSIKINK